MVSVHSDSLMYSAYVEDQVEKVWVEEIDFLWENKRSQLMDGIKKEIIAVSLKTGAEKK